MSEDGSGPRRTIDNRIAAFLDRRQVDQLTGDVIDGDSARRRMLQRALAIALATPVLLLVVGLAAGGGALLVAGDNWGSRAVGVFLLLCFWASLPGRGRASGEPVDPTTAPQLTALLSEVATQVGTHAPNVVRIDAELNASAEPRGLRGRVLTLGAPLWVALSGQARVALLAHELGHFAHRDVLHGRFVWSAYRALGAWYNLLTPAQTLDEAGELVRLMTAIVTAPFRWAVMGYLRLLHGVNASAQRRQELYADLAAVEAAGTPGAIEMLETLLMTTSIEVAANRAAVSSAKGSLLDAIRDRMSEVDAAGRSAARARGADELSRIDSSHPPTIERLRLLEAIAPRSGAVVIDRGTSDAVDRELAPYLDRAARELRDRYLYVY